MHSVTILKNKSVAVIRIYRMKKGHLRVAFCVFSTTQCLQKHSRKTINIAGLISLTMMGYPKGSSCQISGCTIVREQNTVCAQYSVNNPTYTTPLTHRSFHRNSPRSLIPLIMNSGSPFLSLTPLVSSKTLNRQTLLIRMGTPPPS